MGRAGLGSGGALPAPDAGGCCSVREVLDSASTLDEAGPRPGSDDAPLTAGGSEGLAAGGAGAWVEGLPPMSARHAANTPTTTASPSAAAHALRRTGWTTPRGAGWAGDMTGGLNGSSAGSAIGGTGPMLGCGAGAGASASAGVTAGVGGGKPFAGSSGGLGGPDGGLMLGEGTTGGSRAAASANERGFAAISPWLASVLKPLTSPASRFRSFRMNHNGGRGQPASARQRGRQASALGKIERSANDQTLM